eukprot:TRINITY_DN10632_c0_g1_i6.p1 TRINITY_DN10632_c0_g1~~TRINITY_DN10632_c0_g1_i6.p1  ORF type:complete len:144 (-),score=51.84 TRINITY_DN10632_c0_g1_i6:92-523(-)
MNQALAFTYLNEARKLFESEVEKEFGKSYDTQKLESSGKLLFAEKRLDDLMEDYNENEKQTTLQKMNKELADVQKILTEDFEAIVDRDNNLSKIGARAADLKNKSSEFKDRSSQVKWQMMLRNYMFVGIAVAIAGVIVYMVFF